MNRGAQTLCILGAPSDFQKLIDSYSQDAGTKPGISPVLQGISNPTAKQTRKLHFQQKKNYISNRKILRSSLSIKYNSLYFAFPIALTIAH